MLDEMQIHSVLEVFSCLCCGNARNCNFHRDEMSAMVCVYYDVEMNACKISNSEPVQRNMKVYVNSLANLC